ncbi:MAG TPA: TlpA disulfide reductase family protein [Syntrophobacteria bacterium]|nr:TlpA disulfide reductase family protein [Syntrophobacteria bacterium]
MRRHKRQRLQLGTLLVSLIVAAFPSLAAGPATSGRAMDMVLLSDLGQEVRLSELAGGKPTLLFFWATWCTGCRKVQPTVSTLAEKYKGRIQVIGINTGGLDSVQAVSDYRKRNGITYPLLLDRTNQVAGAYGIVAIPAVIVLDRNGQIRFRDLAPPATLEDLL